MPPWNRVREYETGNSPVGDPLHEDATNGRQNDISRFHLDLEGVSKNAGTQYMGSCSGFRFNSQKLDEDQALGFIV